MIDRVQSQQADLTYTLSPSPRLETVEGPVHELLGYSAEDFLSCSISLFDRIHSHDSEIVSALLSPAGEQDSGANVLRVRHAGGRIRCLQMNFHKEEKSSGTTLHLKLQKAGHDWGDALGGDASHLLSMVAHTDERMFFKDVNHVFIAAAANFRASLEQFLNGRDLVGLTDYDFLPESDADVFYAKEKQALADGIPVDALLEVKQGDRPLWVNTQYRAVRGYSEKLLGLFATVREITGEADADEGIAGAGQQQWIGSYVLDLRRGVFSSSNAIEAMFGIDKAYPHDVEGWRSLVYPADRDRMSEYLQSVLEVPGRMFNMEYRIVRRNDGQVRWVQGLGRVDRAQDESPLVMRGTIEDITDRKESEAALRRTKERLQLLIEHAPVGLAMFDRDMVYLAVSRRWQEITGCPSEAILGRCHYEVFPDHPERERQVHRAALAGEPQKCDEDRLETRDGRVQWRRWEALPWRADDGQQGGIISFLEDITTAKEAEQRLQLAASVFDHASEAIMVFDLDMHIIQVNDSFTKITGYSREEALGQHPNILKSEIHDDSFYQNMWKSVREEGRWRGELWNRAKDGKMAAVACTITTVVDASGKSVHYVALFYDITPIKEQEQKLERIAHFDALTGLPNRSLLGDRLRSAMAAARDSNRMLAVIHLDLDNFKTINDRYGRDTADALLLSVAGRMKHVLREGDMIGRLGGDEFVAILPDLATAESATAVLDRLQQAAGEPHMIGEHELRVSATAGTSFYPQSQDVDADQLLRQADQAMYEAKLAGKGQFHVFDPVRDHTLRGRHEELARIRQALNAGELVLYYQPKVNMGTGELVGAEALIRWQHPQRGLLPPAAFLPVIEDDPLAIDVGDWVIDTALAQVDTWLQAGHRIRASVNVSAKQLEQPNFIERLSVLLARHPAVSPSLLELEVLESSALRDVAMVSDVIRACGQMGMHVAIDDFGTGYSSLTYLKRLPAPILKIDQTFVRDMLDDAEDLAILQGILGLATAFRRVPVAEGVESVGHGVVLLKLGCLIGQGYGIARPMPAENLFSWYENWQPDPTWINVATLSPLDWPLLSAEVEQGAWVRALARYVKGEATTFPELDETRSRFGAWIDTEKRNPRASRTGIAVVELLHRRSHRLARRAVALKRRGRQSDAAALLDEVLKLRQEIQAQFDSTLRHGRIGVERADDPPMLSGNQPIAIAKVH